MHYNHVNQLHHASILQRLLVALKLAKEPAVQAQIQSQINVAKSAKNRFHREQAKSTWELAIEKAERKRVAEMLAPIDLGECDSCVLEDVVEPVEVEKPKRGRKPKKEQE